jgi:hypothetical protein
VDEAKAAVTVYEAKRSEQLSHTFNGVMFAVLVCS